MMTTFFFFTEKETIVSYLNVVIVKIFRQSVDFQSSNQLSFSKIVLSALPIALDTVSLDGPLTMH